MTIGDLRDEASEFVSAWCVYRWRLLAAVAAWFLPGTAVAATASGGWAQFWWAVIGFSALPWWWVLRWVDEKYPQWSPFRTYGERPRFGRVEALPAVPYWVNLGVSVLGEPVGFSPKGHAGVLVTGMPGSGKTVLVKYLLASWCAQGADVSIIDMKNGGDFRVFGEVGVPVYSGDVARAVEVLEKAEHLMGERLKVLGSAPMGTPNNFWNLPAGQQPPLIVIAIDEIQDLLETDGVPKEEKAAMERAGYLLRRLVKLGRSAGIVVVASTQKSDGKAIPTNFRDQMSIRISGRQNTREAARAALGELRDDDPRPDDLTLLPPDIPGRFILAGMTAKAVLFQGIYVEDVGLLEMLGA